MQSLEEYLSKQDDAQIMEEAIQKKSEYIINTCHIEELEPYASNSEWEIIVAVAEKMATKKILEDIEDDLIEIEARKIA